MFKPNRKLYQPLVDVTLTIDYTMSEEAYRSESFQEFLENVRNGDMKNEMNEDGFFSKIKISYKVKENEETSGPINS